MENYNANNEPNENILTLEETSNTAELNNDITVYTEQTTEQIIPETATEQLIESGVELLLLLIVLLILFIYQKYKTHPYIIKLKLDPDTLKRCLNLVTEKAKKPLSESAIKKAREKNLKIDILDKNFTKEEIKEMSNEAKEKIKDKEQNFN